MILDKLLSFLYTTLWLVILPFVILRLLWKGRGNRDYLKNIPQRFGFFSTKGKWKNNDATKKIWIHAVSVGEVNVAIPIVLELINQEPNALFLITTMTPTGKAQLLREIEKNNLNGILEHSFVPYDVPMFVNNLLNRVVIEKLIVIETELWPNLYHAANNKGIDIFIANMRLSEKSAKNYAKVKRFIQPMLGTVAKFLVQTEIDAAKVKSLGVEPNKIAVVGNVKYDIALGKNTKAESEALRKRFGSRPVWVAGSTHRGEEDILIEVHYQWIKRSQQGLMILVPRHPERFDEVEKLIKSKGLHCIRLTQLKKSINESTYEDVQTEINSASVILGDTMGELMTLYGAGDLAFVAGSLVEGIGGHNILEPMLLNKVVVHGPYMHKTLKIAEDFKLANGCYCINNGAEMLALLNRWQENALNTEMIIENSQKLLAKNKGATIRCVDVIIA